MTAEEHDDALRVPPAGDDPDSRQRLAKTMVAAGFPEDELPEGLSTDPVTDEERQEAVDRMNEAEERRVEALAGDRDAEKRQAAADRKADAENKDNAGESKVGKETPPQGRTAAANKTKS